MPCIYTTLNRTLEGLSLWYIWSLHPPWVSLSSVFLMIYLLSLRPMSSEALRLYVFPGLQASPEAGVRRLTFFQIIRDCMIWDRFLLLRNRNGGQLREAHIRELTPLVLSVSVCPSIYVSIYFDESSYAFLRDDMTYPRLHTGEKMRHNLSTVSSTKELLPFCLQWGCMFMCG